MNLMFKLIAGLKASRVETRIVAAAKAGEEATIYLYDPIYGSRMMAEWCGGVCAQDLVPDIDAIDADTIRLRINCPGGDVFGMRAIMNALRNHKAKVIAQIDSLCASAATGIACAADEVIVEKGALYMVHNCHGYAYGNKHELRSQADVMDKVDQELVDSYMARTGKKEDEVRAWMDAETWFTAEQCVEAGFADSIKTASKDDKDGKKAMARWDLSGYANAPKAEQAPAPQPEPQPEPIAEPETISAEHRERQQQRMRVLSATSSQAPLAQ